MAPSLSCDVAVLGAGSAGCVVAARLSEHPGLRVVLLEAGGTDDHAAVHDPTMWPTLLSGPLDWGYQTVPQRHCDDRIDHAPRGRMLGGCHSHNANAWVRGPAADYDRWAAAGCAGWEWSQVLPVFRRIEDWHGPVHPLRGQGGPLYVAPPVDPHPVAAAFVAAGPSVGLPIIEDNNGPALEGTSFFNLTIRDGKRWSVATAYLRPALTRPNLTVLTGAEARRLRFAGARCTGVDYLHDGRAERLDARHVVVCAGAYGSPRLLLLSGVGPAEDLARLGIPLVADLPGVGEGLQDHALVAAILYEAKTPLPPPRNNGAEATLWWRSDAALPGPDIQPVVIEFPLATPELAARIPSENCYGIAPSVVRPRSRGSVRLRSADPAVPPAIDPNFLADAADRRALRAAVELARALGAADTFRDLRAREVMPGPLAGAALDAFIRQGASTYFHPAGSCRMGADPGAVVDPRLRVRGLEGLTIADASVMPEITSGNTNAPSVMIGERAADFLRDDLERAR